MSSADFKMDSVFATGLTCQNCESELETSFIASTADVVIRCGNCGELFSPLQNTGAVDKNAWRSLWLGLASLLLFCFTGIPALYFGIKSLLRGRYTRTRPQDRRAAVAGIMLGGLFGIFGSFCVFGFGGAILVAILSNVTTESTEQARYILQGVASMNMPDELVSGRASKTFGSSDFSFVDDEDSDKRSLRFDFVFFPPAMTGSVATLNSQLRNKQLHTKGTYKKLSEELLKWNLGDRTIGVTKIVFEETRDEQPTIEICQYYGYSAVKSGIFGFAFLHSPADSGLTEQRIREFVESITPRENIDVRDRWKSMPKPPPKDVDESEDQQPAQGRVDKSPDARQSRIARIG